MDAKKALRWKKDPAPKGLSRIGAGPRGSFLHDGEKTYARVRALGRDGSGWFWTAGWDSGIPRKNTCGEPCPDEATAKTQAIAYVKAELAKEQK